MLAPGTIVDEKYEIRRLIGSGGMGAVYEVYQESLDRTVALKILTNIIPETEDEFLRFEREALILSKLNHSNIVRFYAYGRYLTSPYIVMERLTGISLQSVLDLGVEPKTMLDYAIEICAGLEYAHKNGICHRDIKPSNVILEPATTNGVTIKLIDFGLAKLSAEWQAQKLTQTGLALGSVVYMSPEQCTGSDVDPRADIYSFGCLLFHGLTGSPPFYAEDAVAVMYRHLNEPVNELERWEMVSPPLQRVIERCMAKDPNKRYATISEVKEELESLSSRPDAIKRQKLSGAQRKLRTATTKRPILYSVAAATTAAIGIAAAMFCFPSDKAVSTIQESPAQELERVLSTPCAGSSPWQAIKELTRCIERNKNDVAVNETKLLNAYARLADVYMETNKNQLAQQVVSEAFNRHGNLSEAGKKSLLVAALDYYHAASRIGSADKSKPLLLKALARCGTHQCTSLSRLKICLASIYLRDGDLTMSRKYFEDACDSGFSIMRTEEILEAMQLAQKFPYNVRTKDKEWLREHTPLPPDNRQLSQDQALQLVNSLTLRAPAHSSEIENAAALENALALLRTNPPAQAQRAFYNGYLTMDSFYVRENNYTKAAEMCKIALDAYRDVAPDARFAYSRLACAEYCDQVLGQSVTKPDDSYVQKALKNPPDGPYAAGIKLVAAGIAFKNDQKDLARTLFEESAPNLRVLHNEAEIQTAFDLARAFGTDSMKVNPAVATGGESEI